MSKTGVTHIAAPDPYSIYIYVIGLKDITRAKYL